MPDLATRGTIPILACEKKGKGRLRSRTDHAHIRTYNTVNIRLRIGGNVLYMCTVLYACTRVRFFWPRECHPYLIPIMPISWVIRGKGGKEGGPNGVGVKEANGIREDGNLPTIISADPDLFLTRKAALASFIRCSL